MPSRRARASTVQASQSPRSSRAARKPRPLKRLDEYVDLFDFAPVTYALIDQAGIIRTTNLAAARLLGASRKQLLMQPLLTFVIDADRTELLDHFRRCRASHGVVESEIRFARNGRGMVTCRVFSKRVWYEHHPAFPTVIIDLSERLQLEEARLAAERERRIAERSSEAAQAGIAAKDRFLATVSHELRTPLTPALLAASQLASWDGLPEEARRLAATIKRNIQFEARLIEDLLDVARINRDRIVLDLKPVAIHELVQEAIEICRPAADAKKQMITAQFAAAAQDANADKLRLRQVFWNLLNNAIKFTPPGGEIVVRTANLSSGVLKISIRDNGEGMDTDVLTNLFAPFDRQLASHDSRGGLGLGLSICKGIIAAHHGQIWAMSDGPGCGSTFAVELVTTAHEETKPRTPAPSDQTDARPVRTRVLVIEDDQDSREMIVAFLSKHGYRAESASTFDEAIERLDESWDVVLTDLSLPDGSGLDIARRARNLERPPSRVIAFTGYGSSDDLRVSQEAGFDDHLVKPLDLETLLKAVGGGGKLRWGTGGRHEPL